VRWLVDGYNVIRRSPELAAAERVSLEAGRTALCRLLAGVAEASGDQFTVVFDGSGRGSSAGGAGVRVLFSSARERADQVLARLAAQGGAVVSNDREVRRAAARAGAIAVSTDDFLACVSVARPIAAAADEIPDKDEGEEPPPRLKKGNPRRLGKKARAASRALNRLRGGGSRLNS
jgi:predicted RNA-binding protein with PIN domain